MPVLLIRPQNHCWKRRLIDRIWKALQYQTLYHSGLSLPCDAMLQYAHWRSSMFRWLTHLCFQTKPSMLLVSKPVLAYLVTIKEIAGVELHPWSGGGDGQGAA